MKRKQNFPAGRPGPPKTRAEVLAEVKRLEQAGNHRKLHAYLIQLAKLGDQPAQYESLFRAYLHSPEATLREAAVFCLLFALQIQHADYRAQALLIATNEEEDFDARMWAGSSLAVAYRNSRDPELLAAFLAVIDDDTSDKHLKVSFVRNIVLLLGLSSRARWLRAQADSLPMLREEFAAELATARELARSR